MHDRQASEHVYGMHIYSRCIRYVHVRARVLMRDRWAMRIYLYRQLG